MTTIKPGFTMSNKYRIIGAVVTMVVVIGGGWYALAARPKSIATLAAELSAQDSATRHHAARQLATIGPPRATEAMAQLTAAMKDTDKTVRHYAAKTLAEIGLDAKPATAALIDDINDTDADTRYYVVKALSKLELDKNHVHAVAGLIRTLKDDNPKTRYYTAKTLKSIGSTANAAIPALREATKDQDKDVRDAATTALKKVSKTT